MLVDMHAHVIPHDFPSGADRHARWPSLDHFEAARANVMIAGENFRTVHSGNWDIPRRLQDMASAGVDVEVISPLPELTSYWFDARDGLDICRYVNEFMAGMCAAAPGKFVGLGIVPLQDPDLATRELATLRANGLTGVELGTNVNGRSLGVPEFHAFFQEAARLGIPIFVHASHPRFESSIGVRLENSIGYPSDTGLTIASIIEYGVAEQCPELRIAFSHGGGTFPFMLPRYQHAFSGRWNQEPPAPDHPSQGKTSPWEYARRFYYDTLLFDRRAIAYLLDVIGPERLLVGTDYPYMAREAPVGKTLRGMGLDAAVVDAIAWGNCFRFLGIEAPVVA